MDLLRWWSKETFNWHWPRKLRQSWNTPADLRRLGIQLWSHLRVQHYFYDVLVGTLSTKQPRCHHGKHCWNFRRRKLLEIYNPRRCISRHWQWNFEFLFAITAVQRFLIIRRRCVIGIMARIRRKHRWKILQNGTENNCGGRGHARNCLKRVGRLHHQRTSNPQR